MGKRGIKVTQNLGAKYYWFLFLKRIKYLEITPPHLPMLFQLIS